MLFPDNGFTLIELMVVLAITGLILLFIPSQFDSLIARKQLQQDATKIVNCLKQGRQQAISQQQPQTVAVNTQSNQLRCATEKHVFSLGEQRQLSVLTARQTQTSETSAEIWFFADGSSSGGSIAIATKPYHYDIEINWLTGSIKVINL